jgi:hypothetical protein
MRRWPDSAASTPLHHDALASGAAIVNARGIPGTLGFLARTRHDGRAVLVSSHHVLFGDGAREGDPVWLAHDSRGASLSRIGRLWYGRAGVVRVGDADVWIDAAVATLDGPSLAESAFDVGSADECIAGQAVSMRGAATGFISGTLVDADYLDPSPAPRARPDAPAQLLARSSSRNQPFAAAGDSGAALCDASGAILGLLWGVTARGDGVACPIDVLLHVLHVRVARPVPRAATIGATMRDR